MYRKEEFDLVLKLGEELKEMYDNAKTGEQVTMIHLFGIKNGEVIKQNNIKVADIVHVAGINDSYKTEVSKGVKLSEYVDITKKIS